MAGLLAWAADVVGGSGQDNNNNEENNQFSSVVIFTPEQQRYAQELELKSNSLKRSIQDLRLRIPPPDISQRLPHLHAHSLASNADLALQLSAHSTTKQQAQSRGIMLQEENAAYEKAISTCEWKIQEKLGETDLLQSKLKEMEITENHLRREVEVIQTEINQSSKLDDCKTTIEDQKHTASNTVMLDKLEAKRKELNLMEEKVQELEKRWMLVQQNSLSQPSPAQREKILDKQLHSLIEQLASKQAQAESLVGEIHVKERELETLNGFRRRLDNGAMEVNTRSRLGQSSSWRRSSPDFIIETHLRQPYVGDRTPNQQRLMLFRSAFVLYILILHVLVFIKLSF